MRGALALVLVACGCKGTEGPDDTEGPSSGALSVLSYNVHGLPPSITGDDTAGRMAQIAPLLPSYDLVGLQEDWDEANHEILASTMGDYPTSLWYGEPLDGRAYGSGLGLFARATLVDAQLTTYETCYGTLDSASDCLASKGLLAARLALADGVEVDVYNTHFEAGGGAEDDAARAAQVDMVIEVMNSWSTGRAMIFMGDTNLGDDDPEDLPLVALLEEQTGLVEVCDLVGCPEPGRIDRIFVRDGGGVTLSAESWAVPSEFIDSEGVPLSDHDAITAQITWDVP